MQGALDQQSTQPGAIYEQISFDSLVTMCRQRGDKTRLRVLCDSGDLTLDTAYAFRLATSSQKGGVEAGIKVVRIAERCEDGIRVIARWSKAARQCGLCRQGIGLVRVRRAGELRPDPAVIEHRGVMRTAI